MSRDSISVDAIIRADGRNKISLSYPVGTGDNVYTVNHSLDTRR